VLLTLISSFIFYNGGANSNTHLDEYKTSLSYPRYCHIGVLKEDYNIKNKDLVNCKIGNVEKKTVGLVWGDSYAGVLDPFVENVLDNEFSAVSRTAAYCPPSLSLSKMLGSSPEYCKKIRALNIQEVTQNRHDVIFLAGRWDSMYAKHGEEGLDSLFEAVDFASDHSKVVYIFEQPIHYKKSVGRQFLRSKIISTSPKKMIRDDKKVIEVNQLLKSYFTKKNYKNVYYVSRDVLYGSTTHSDYTNNALPFTYDKGHLSMAGSLAASYNFKNSALYIPFVTLIK
jgi:hypothetical protein